MNDAFSLHYIHDVKNIL